MIIKQNYWKIFKDKRLVLFDMDGTVTKTEDLNYEIYKNVINKIFDLELCKKDWGIFFSGRSPKESLTEYSAKHNILITQSLLNNLLTEIYKSKNQKLRRKNYKIKIVRGFVEFVKILKKEDFKTGLVTSTSRDFVKIILSKTQTTDYFDKIITRENCKVGKPNPDIYFFAMRLLRMNPKDTIIFEDSQSGLMAAVNSGATVIKIGRKQTSVETKF